MYVLERSQLIPGPREAVSRFFEDPRNLAGITPSWLSFRIIRFDGLPLRSGSRIEYRIRWLGIPRRWQTLITEYEPGRRFVDVQTRGPYRFWRHEHTFEDQDAETLMRDRVEYELPFGALGRMVHGALIARQLRGIFDFRAARIRPIFAEEVRGGPPGRV